MLHISPGRIVQEPGNVQRRVFVELPRRHVITSANSAKVLTVERHARVTDQKEFECQQMADSDSTDSNFFINAVS